MSNIRFKVMESTRSAAQSVFAHRFRSFLTTLGIIIGVASVIAVVSVVQGFSASISAQFDDIGTNVVNIDAYTPPKSRLQGNWARLTYEDYLKLKYQIPGVSHVTPNLQVRGSYNGVTFAINLFLLEYLVPRPHIKSSTQFTVRMGDSLILPMITAGEE